MKSKRRKECYISYRQLYNLDVFIRLSHWPCFLSYRILDIADLTTDGCFVLGMAVSVSCCAGGHPFAGVILGMIAGGCAGCVTAILQTRLGVPSILAGIVTNTGLYTINLMAMGWSSNIFFIKRMKTIFLIV